MTKLPNAERGGFPLTVRSLALYEAAAKDYPRSRELPRIPSMVWSIDGRGRAIHPNTGHQVDQSSPNHEARAFTIELLRAAAWGTAAEISAALAVVLVWLDRELRQVGLWTSEQGCPSPHGGMHIEAAVNARLAAIKLGHAELMAQVLEHWRRLFALLDLCSTPGGLVFMAGERCKSAPVSDQATAVLRALKGLPQTGGARRIGTRAESSGDRDYFASLVGVRVLQGLGDLAPRLYPAVFPSRGLPLLKCPMQVTRWSGGHLAQITQRRDGNVVELCDWAFVEHAYADKSRGRSGYSYGKAFAHQAPRCTGRVLQSERRAA
jgi:hypothetical protein